jgi:hypothetical protein
MFPADAGLKVEEDEDFIHEKATHILCGRLFGRSGEQPCGVFVGRYRYYKEVFGCHSTVIITGMVISSHRLGGDLGALVFPSYTQFQTHSKRQPVEPLPHGGSVVYHFSIQDRKRYRRLETGAAHAGICAFLQLGLGCSHSAGNQIFQITIG